MKVPNPISRTLPISIFCVGLIISCSGVRTVDFETPVDTSDKQITFQERQVYFQEDLGLFVDNTFDGARLNGVEKLNDSTLKAIIRPENEPINSSPYYAFKIASNTPKKMYVSLEYPQGHAHRYAPKVKKPTKDWEILDSTKIFIMDSLVTLELSLDEQPTLIAAQELQTSEQVKDWYHDLSSGKGYVRPYIYGTSKMGRELPVLDIYRGGKTSKPIIVLLTRQHPPEVTGFFAFKAFLETVLDDSELSNTFLDTHRVLAFPILNPDGVDLGHWRHNAGGVDTNRDWSKYRQPEIHQTVEFIEEQLKKDGARLLLGLDFHSTHKDVFYTNTSQEGSTLPHFEKDWFSALEENIPHYKVNESSGNSTKPVSKGWFLKRHRAVGITYEIGDNTPRDRIRTIGRVSAQEMMKILRSNTNLN